MAQIFECWFPETGETLRDSGAFLADDPKEAAEKAAAFRCRKDVEWTDHLVAVSALIGDVPKLYDVTVESRPGIYRARARRIGTMTMAKAAKTFWVDRFQTLCAEHLTVDAGGDIIGVGAASHAFANEVMAAVENARPATPRCAECNGDGTVRRSFGYIPCAACNGKGF